MTQKIKLKQIELTGDRARKDYQGIESLAQSVQENGLIQPLVLRRIPIGDPSDSGNLQDDRYELAAGGRRYRALELAGIEELTYGLTSVPNAAGFVFADSLTETQRLVIELEENFNRQDFDWKESVQLIARIHSAKKREMLDTDITWGQRQTGILLNVSLGKVNNALKVVEAMNAGNQQVLKAESLQDALKVLLEQRETEAMQRLSSITHIPFNPKLDGKAGTKKPNALDSDDNWLTGDQVQVTPENGTQMPASYPASTAALSSSDEQNGKATPTVLDIVEVPLSQMIYHGDSIREIAPAWPAETVDHIYTDIPFGIDPENMADLEGFEHVVAEHQVEENIELMQLFLPEAFRVLKTGGFCVFWCDLEHWEKLSGWAKAAGFKVQRWPLFWDKLHPTKNQAPQYNFTKSVETAMVLRKGNATLIKPQVKNIIAVDGSIERKMFKHPFWKPFELHKWVLNAIAIPGQSIWDPFAGRGSIPRACVNLGLRPLAGEKSDVHYPHLVENMKQAYLGLTRGKAKFV